MVVLAIVAALCLAAADANKGWTMEVMSKDFEPAGVIPSQFTCQGEGVSPSLAWNDPPSDTQSFAITVLDPDVPHRDFFVHWISYDIPASVREIPQGGPLPHGAKELRNDFDQRGWSGPCPTMGPHDHHYVFTVYALNVPSLGELKRENWLEAIRAHTLGSARLEGHYSMH
ncbi:MAG: YbhB/YbcL family Raf kinase inhibitor-like protein [Pseudomonadota bacterium]